MSPLLTRRQTLTAMTGALAATGFAAARTRSEAEPPTWRRGADLPHAAQEIYPTAFRGGILLAGGLVLVDGRSGAGVQTVWWNPRTDTWTHGPDLPAARHHPGLVGLDERVFAIGGFSRSAGAGWRMERTVFVLDAAMTGWSDGPPLPEPRAEFVSGVIGGRIVVTGGRRPRGDANAQYGDHGDVAGTLILDPAFGTWRAAAPAPSARNSAAAAVIDGRLHVVGGRRLTERGLVNVPTHEVYEPVSDRWDVRAPMPQGQGGLAAATFGGQLYAFGGEYFGATSGVYKDTWVYDPAADAWAPLPPMPLPRHGLGAVTLSDGIHVIGGATEAGGRGRSRHHSVLAPSTAMPPAG
ncbi:MAG: hypothetical protein HKN62_14735 [Phycisphaerales bacterium]|nr:hypothetical protein [Phycisphaerales bacterium]